MPSVPKVVEKTCRPSKVTRNGIVLGGGGVLTFIPSVIVGNISKSNLGKLKAPPFWKLPIAGQDIKKQ